MLKSLIHMAVNIFIILFVGKLNGKEMRDYRPLFVLGYSTSLLATLKSLFANKFYYPGLLHKIK